MAVKPTQDAPNDAGWYWLKFDSIGWIPVEYQTGDGWDEWQHLNAVTDDDLEFLGYGPRIESPEYDL